MSVIIVTSPQLRPETHPGDSAHSTDLPSRTNPTFLVAYDHTRRTHAPERFLLAQAGMVSLPGAGRESSALTLTATLSGRLPALRTAAIIS